MKTSLPGIDEGFPLVLAPLLPPAVKWRGKGARSCTYAYLSTVNPPRQLLPTLSRMQLLTWSSLSFERRESCTFLSCAFSMCMHQWKKRIDGRRETYMMDLFCSRLTFHLISFQKGDERFFQENKASALQR